MLKNFFITIFLFSFISCDILSRKIFSFEKKSFGIVNNYNTVNNFSIDYILDKGDVIFINFVGAPFLSSSFTIDQEGKINLPEVNSIYVGGLTVAELEKLLRTEYDKFLFDSEIKISILKYRPIQVLINGEVVRPGIYDFGASFIGNDFPGDYKDIPGGEVPQIYTSALPFQVNRLDDVIRSAQGITNNADLSKIVVVRKNPLSNGGGKIKGEFNFLSLLNNGDLSQNIRVYDGDAIFISKTNNNIKDQIFNFNKTNLNPEFIEVFITGNIDSLKKGIISLKQGINLNQAIAAAGGRLAFTGKIEFIRFYDNDTKTRRKFKYDPSSKENSKTNPILMSGDIINVQRNFAGTATNTIGAIARPLTSGFLLYNIISE